jgi:hypothetical protein
LRRRGTKDRNCDHGDEQHRGKHEPEVEHPLGALVREHLGDDQAGEDNTADEHDGDHLRPRGSGTVVVANSIGRVRVDDRGVVQELIVHEIGRITEVRRTDREAEPIVRASARDAPCEHREDMSDAGHGG